MTEQASWIGDVDRGVLDDVRPDRRPVDAVRAISVSASLVSVVDRRVT